MGAGLVGEYVRHDATLDQLRQHVGNVRDQSDGDGLLVSTSFVENRQGFVDAPGDMIAVAALEALLDAHSIDINTKKKRAIHGRGEWLGASHPAHSAGDNELPFQAAAEVLAASFGESLIGA